MTHRTGWDASMIAMPKKLACHNAVLYTWCKVENVYKALIYGTSQEACLGSFFNALRQCAPLNRNIPALQLCAHHTVARTVVWADNSSYKCSLLYFCLISYTINATPAKASGSIPHLISIARRGCQGLVFDVKQKLSCVLCHASTSPLHILRTAPEKLNAMLKLAIAFNALPCGQNCLLCFVHASTITPHLKTREGLATDTRLPSLIH